MKKILVTIMLAWSGISGAETPQILTDAVSAYQKNGYNAFAPTLLEGAVCDKDGKIQSTITSFLPVIEKSFGKLQSLEVLREVNFSRKSKNTYFVLNYDNSPLYGVLTTFKGLNGDVVASVYFNMSAKVVLPQSMIEGEK